MTSQAQLSSIAHSLNYLDAFHDARGHTLALIEDLTGKQLMGLAPFLTKNADVISSEVSQVSALGKPDKDAALFNQVLADGRTAASYFREAATAAAAGNRSGFLAAFKKLMAQTPHGKAFGFRHCDVPSS